MNGLTQIAVEFYCDQKMLQTQAFACFFDFTIVYYVFSQKSC